MTARPEPPGSGLYLRVIAPDESFDRINARVWSGTPWVVNTFVGGPLDGRRREISTWCRDRFGEEAWPFGERPRPGRWKRGYAYVFGWMWIGFSTEAEMQEFVAAWPDPEGVSP